MTKYSFSVCKVGESSHTHYNVAMVDPHKYTSPTEVLRLLSFKIGGSTAGQIIQRILDLISVGTDLRMYGVDHMLTEDVPLYQKCIMPSVDWDYNIIPSAASNSSLKVNNNVRIARIRSSCR